MNPLPPNLTRATDAPAVVASYCQPSVSVDVITTAFDQALWAERILAFPDDAADFGARFLVGYRDAFLFVVAQATGFAASVWRDNVRQIVTAELAAHREQNR